MITSDFNEGAQHILSAEGEETPLFTSSRFDFFKLRIFGATHLVKRVSRLFNHDAMTLEALRKEFSIGINLDHPGIVRYFKFEDNSIYEEFIDGVTLRQLIDSRDARLSDCQFIHSITRQLLEALDYMHKSGVIHHDIKPDNIMITRIGERIKIIDFGAAVSSLNDSTPGFTAAYAAPEQSDCITDCRSDLYLLGKTLSETSQLKSSRKWRKFIEKSTDENLDMRFQSAEEALLYLFPKGSMNQRILYFGAALSIAGAVGLTLLLTHEDSKDKENINPTVVQVTDTVYLQSDTAIETGLRTSTPNLGLDQAERNEGELAVRQDDKQKASVSQQEKLETSLHKQIESKVTNAYNSRILPVVEHPERYGCQQSSSDQLNIMSQEQDKIIQEVYAWRDKLIKQYPDQKDFITSEISNAITTNSNNMGYLRNVYRQKLESQKKDSANPG